MYILAERFNREAPAQEEAPTNASPTSRWVGVQGFVAGLILSILGVVAVAFLSSDENRAARSGWAIGGALTTLALVLLTV
jgi:uncharacterized membrane protein